MLAAVYVMVLFAWSEFDPGGSVVMGTKNEERKRRNGWGEIVSMYMFSSFMLKEGFQGCRCKHLA